MTLLGSALRFKHMLTSATPAAGQLALFAKNDNALWVKKPDGTEQLVGGLVGSTPLTTLSLGWASGWGATGAIKYQKFGNVVTLYVEAPKSSAWTINEPITTSGLPVDIRPSGVHAGTQGLNSAVDNAPRSFWVSSADGLIRAAQAGTGTIWGVVTYQVPSIERSTAMNSGAMTTALTPGSGVTIGAGTSAHVRGGIVEATLNLSLPANMAHNALLCTFPDGYRPPFEWYEDAMVVSATEVMYRVVILPNGEMRIQVTSPAMPAGVPILRDSVTFPAAISAAGLGTLVDTGWVSYTPTAQGGSTAFTSYTASGKYRRVGNTVNFTVEVNVTNVGGASGQEVRISLPYQIASGLRHVASGRENAVTGTMLQGVLNPGATQVTVFTYTNSGMAATGHQYIVSGTYEAVPL